ncbi:MAG: glycosyltransferase family A protein [Bacteroidales bacterium]|nr:glycosyltransferase family A protein [Bacteroidales bacterium]
MNAESPHSLSVIIPVRNRASVVGRTLESVAAQTVPPRELILVDNGSTDDTAAVLRSFAHSHPELHVAVASEPQPGACAARNRGLAMASGEWVAFFDSDDVMHPTLLESYRRCIASHGTDAGVVMVQGRIIGTDGRLLRRMPLFGTDCLAQHVLHGMLSTQCYAARRSLVMAVGGWDTTLPRWQDYELGVRLLLSGARVAVAGSRVLVDVMRSGEESITGTSFSRHHAQLERALDVVEADIARSGHPDSRRLRRLVGFRRLTLAAHYQREGQPQLARPLLHRALSGIAPSPLLRPALLWLYRRIAAGRRGSARIARLLLH